MAYVKCCLSVAAVLSAAHSLAVAVPSPEDCSESATNPTIDYEPTSLLEIDVVVHILMDSDCAKGAVSDSTVADQIGVLNEDYLALPETNGGEGADSQIRFVLAARDPNGASTSGITRNCDDAWHADSGDYWTSLAWDPHRYLNIYVNSAGGSSGYVPFLPAQESDRIGTAEDRVTINHLAFGLNGPIPRRSLGRIGTHEIGHYLGLFHTYQEGCGVETAPDCYTTGDRLCDTAPNAESHVGCPVGITSCGGVVAPVENHMELTDDGCKRGFTPEQAKRMRCTLQHYRSQLANAGSGSDAGPDAVPEDAGLGSKDDDANDPANSNQQGCSCRTAGGGGSWLWVLLVALVLGRRSEKPRVR